MKINKKKKKSIGKKIVKGKSEKEKIRKGKRKIVQGKITKVKWGKTGEISTWGNSVEGNKVKGENQWQGKDEKGKSINRKKSQNIKEILGQNLYPFHYFIIKWVHEQI